jgi:hypothetical protein
METTQVNTGGESGLDHLQSVESGPEIDVGGHSFEVITFGQNSVMDGKELKRFITAVERFIRSSMDYKKYLGFLKCEVGMNRCSEWAILMAAPLLSKCITTRLRYFKYVSMLLTRWLQKTRTLIRFQ